MAHYPKILCDHCGNDLSLTTNSEDHRLKIDNDRIPCWDRAVTDQYIVPPLDRPRYFCGLGCLAAWCKQKVTGNLRAPAKSKPLPNLEG